MVAFFHKCGQNAAGAFAHTKNPKFAKFQILRKLVLNFTHQCWGTKKWYNKLGQFPRTASTREGEGMVFSEKWMTPDSGAKSGPRLLLQSVLAPGPNTTGPLGQWRPRLVTPGFGPTAFCIETPKAAAALRMTPDSGPLSGWRQRHFGCPNS